MVIGFFCRTTPLLSFCNDRAVPNRHASSRAGKPGEQMNQVERERGREGEPSNFLAWFLLFLTASNSSDDLDCLAAAAASRAPTIRERTRRSHRAEVSPMHSPIVAECCCIRHGVDLKDDFIHLIVRVAKINYV